MQKLFFEVFPTLEVEAGVRGLLGEAVVTKVSTNSEKDHLRIYLQSTRLIPKSLIFRLERMIREQLFSFRKMTVKIIEKFQLSAQYDPQKLLEAYHDSLLEELRSVSQLEYSLLKNARMEFEEPHVLRLVLEDSPIAAQKADDIVSFLEKVVCERCGMDLVVEPVFEEPQKSHRADSDFLIANEVRGILSRSQAFGGVAAVAGQPSGVGQLGDTGQPEAQAGDAQWPDDAGQPSGAGWSGGASQQPPQGNQASLKGQAGRPVSGSKGDARRKGDAERVADPGMVYGRSFEGEAIPIEQIVGDMGEVILRGKLLSAESREIRNGKSLVLFAVTDFTDTILVKIFVKTEIIPKLMQDIKVGAFLKIKGTTTIDRYDNELVIGSVSGIQKIPDFTTMRMDTSVEKRVELHCHTKMSDMDGVSEVKDILARAISWGHKALAVTDHGDVQAFPDASHAIPKDSDFKVIYGVEAYLVDDLKEIVVDSRNQPLLGDYVVFDLETTGLNPRKDRIIEIGAAKVVNGEITEEFSTFVNPQMPIPYEIEQLTSINDEMVLGAPTIEEVLPNFMDFCGDAVMVAHNASFDMGFLQNNCEGLGIPCHASVLDTMMLARTLIPSLKNFKLDTVAKEVGVSLEHHHRAVDDAKCTAEIFLKFVSMLEERGIEALDAVNELGKSSPEGMKKMHSYHAIILATNDVGRTNLYRLISYSHLDYFYRQPRIPKSEILKHREGLILGSACEAGELYRAILGHASEAEIARIVRFYDYLEIQPLGNNAFMLRGDKPMLSSMEELKDINRRIVSLGEEFHKPVVATCDVHFLDPEDEVYRRIIMAGKGFKDADEQAPLYLRTTEEMLAEFDYLGSEKAREVVITNTNKIADMCERIEPVRPDKCPPVIENSDQMLRDICYRRAHEVYGEELPEIVKERLERELHSIISNGFAVMYIIAQKLVWKSNEDGYLVGSRGSVGSSLVATMAGITEVNPLPPHYYCGKCHYHDFDSEEVKAYAGKAGCDMPDKKCPVCGEPLHKEGFDIPFETFLGFKGNKEPDIDLNFSGEYQGKAHKYTEVIFGEGQTFRAGTIGTLADKTAFGYVKNYYEERGIHKRKCEISRIVDGCVGVRRTTGQHPGGIIVLPLGEEIYSFTPIQHPANDTETDIVTTHFDYHSIDHNLLKLDILGHDDPTMIRMLEDLTGVNAREIPLDNKDVMSLFQSTRVLGITPDDIGGCPLGSLGIPEFGTEFAMQMLLDTKPQTFSDLVRIAGLSHGTDVWLGNAQTLIKEGKATISTAICTRDDIMTYLIGMGMDSELSFSIMESVRKGKGLLPEWEEAMRSANVPDWYIWSCKKIKYMFPKAHAAAYVMMAWRIAFCKVYYPLAYYAAFFSIRATDFDYGLMCQGKGRLEQHIRDYESRKDSLSKKEQGTLRDMKVVQEMYARGFEFVPIDLYQAKSHAFQIMDGKLMPSFNAIAGLGDKAADAIAEAAQGGAFLSKDDFRQRTRVSKTVIDLMDSLGVLGQLPETNQLSLFDF